MAKRRDDGRPSLGSFQESWVRAAAVAEHDQFVDTVRSCHHRVSRDIRTGDPHVTCAVNPIAVVQVPRTTTCITSVDTVNLLADSLFDDVRARIINGPRRLSPINAPTARVASPTATQECACAY